MLNGFSVLAVIPARRGSRGIPDKNTIDLAGKPLIQWTIDSAKNSHYIDRILVSTDDPKAIAIASSQGVEVLERPDNISGDTATAAQVIAHVLSTTRVSGIVVYLQPTSPLRDSLDIDRCLELLGASQAEGVVSVTEVTEHPEWMYRLGSVDDILQPVSSGNTVRRRQDLPKTVRLNGALYCAQADSLRPDGDIFRLVLAGYEMPASRSLDIDEPMHLALAESLMKPS